MSFAIRYNGYPELLYLLENWMTIREVTSKGIHPYSVLGIPKDNFRYL